MFMSANLPEDNSHWLGFLSSRHGNSRPRQVFQNSKHDLLKVALFRIVRAKDAAVTVNSCRLTDFHGLFLHFVRHFEASRNEFHLGLHVVVGRRRRVPSFCRSQWRNATFPKHFERQFGRRATKEDLLLNWSPGKREVVFSNDDQLALHPLVIHKTLFGHLTESHVSRKLTSAPLASRLFSQFNWLQKWALEGVFLLVRLFKVSHRVKVSLECNLTSRNILVARHLGCNQCIIHVGYIDKFVAMGTILANPQAFQVELRQTVSRLHRSIVVHL
mmetsp:Transcript_16171/g.44500  ORF Transcript_16171/g.44500 Transcript_16171/m.44500 type:complete len:273 (+) Transcript_16171:152-970(+)